MAYIQPVTHSIILEVSEAIENGYSYEAAVESIRAEYGISDHSLARIHDLMSSHDMEADRGYMKLAIDITKELEGSYTIKFVYASMTDGEHKTAVVDRDGHIIEDTNTPITKGEIETFGVYVDGNPISWDTVKSMLQMDGKVPHNSTLRLNLDGMETVDIVSIWEVV